MHVRRHLHARRLRSVADSINSGRHILAFTIRRALCKWRVFDFVPSYLKTTLKIGPSDNFPTEYTIEIFKGRSLLLTMQKMTWKVSSLYFVLKLCHQQLFERYQKLKSEEPLLKLCQVASDSVHLF